jgi:hypothetical protein
VLEENFEIVDCSEVEMPQTALLVCAPGETPNCYK